MSQYFENDPNLKDQSLEVQFKINEKEYHLQSNQGVFSKDKLDMGSRILIETILEHQEKPSSFLDLGCGIGPIGLVLQDHWHTQMTMIDVNERAVSLAKRNMKTYRLDADIVCQDGIQEGQYECIALNPPIRTGKKVIYRLFDECMEHCSGSLWLVMRKQHGAASAIRYLEEKNHQVEVVHKEKGYWIFRVS